MMDKTYGIIDIGSNSVRLLTAKVDENFSIVSSDKISVSTRLAEGMKDGVLSSDSIERTARAVAFLNDTAIKGGATSIFAFATAAVRNAVNGDEFIRLVKEYCNLSIDVLTGEEEARTGFSGAVDGFGGGLIDVGGASSEVIVLKDGKPVYVYSLPIGAVRVKDACGQNKEKADAFIKENVAEYGDIPFSDFTAIGGTATSVAAMLLKLDKYDRAKVDGSTVKVSDLRDLADKLFSLTVEERKKIKSLQESRAEIIAGGALLLLRIAEKIGVDSFRVSESDNLEGYLKEKVKGFEKKN